MCWDALPHQVLQYGESADGRCEHILWTDASGLSWQWTGNSLEMEHLSLKQAKQHSFHIW